MSTGSTETARVISVAFIAAAAEDLDRSCDREHLSATDIINRAAVLYEFVTSQVADGADLILRKDGQEQLVLLMSVTEAASGR